MNIDSSLEEFVNDSKKVDSGSEFDIVPKTVGEREEGEDVVV